MGKVKETHDDEPPETRDWRKWALEYSAFAKFQKKFNQWDSDLPNVPDLISQFKAYAVIEFFSDDTVRPEDILVLSVRALSQEHPCCGDDQGDPRRRRVLIFGWCVVSAIPPRSFEEQKKACGNDLHWHKKSSTTGVAEQLPAEQIPEKMEWNCSMLPNGEQIMAWSPTHCDVYLCEVTVFNIGDYAYCLLWLPLHCQDVVTGEAASLVVDVGAGYSTSRDFNERFKHLVGWLKWTSQEEMDKESESQAEAQRIMTQKIKLAKLAKKAADEEKKEKDVAEDEAKRLEKWRLREERRKQRDADKKKKRELDKRNAEYKSPYLNSRDWVKPSKPKSLQRKINELADLLVRTCDFELYAAPSSLGVDNLK